MLLPKRLLYALGAMALYQLSKHSPHQRTLCIFSGGAIFSLLRHSLIFPFRASRTQRFNSTFDWLGCRNNHGDFNSGLDSAWLERRHLETEAQTQFRTVR